METDNMLVIIALLQKYSNQVPDWVIKAREYHKELKALINGDDFENLLIKIEHIEDDDKQKARKKYARSTKDLFENLLRPIDNVYTSTGGSKKYGQSEDILKRIANIRDGKTLENWLRINWMKLYHNDPNGVIFFEWLNENTYPTYKSIEDIRYYETNGQKCNFIIFEPKDVNGKKLWRFVDANYDYTFIQNGENFTIDIEKTYLNPFGYCPAIVNSDIIELGSQIRKSPIDSIIEIAKEYLRDQSIKIIFKFLHGYPIFWRYAVQCNKCAGTGKTGSEKCPDCNGFGYYVKKDITDAVILPAPKSNEDLKLAPDIAGFIAPELKTWDQYTNELRLQKDSMYETLWGTTFITSGNDTATGRFIDTQPVINKLNDYAQIAEWIEWWSTELVINFYNQTKPRDKHEAIILYGRNYIIEPINVLLQRYEDSKSKGDNTAILDKLLEEWLYAKYKNDPETLQQELNRLKIEPYIHYTVKEVYDYYGQKEAQNKMDFCKWWYSVENKNQEVEKLKEQFNQFKTINI